MITRAASQHAMVFVPAAVIWELPMLARVRQIDLGRLPRLFFADLFSNSSYQVLDVTPEQVDDASELGFVGDAFDGLIVAAARSLDLPLITRDEVVGASGRGARAVVTTRGSYRRRPAAAALCMG